MARRSQGGPASNRVKLTYNATITSVAGVVLDYLINSVHFTSRHGRQMAIDAISAFYRPVAEEMKGKLSQAELREVAHHCVEMLLQQADVLCKRYDLENPMNLAAEQTLVGQFTDSQTSTSEMIQAYENHQRRLQFTLEKGLGAIASALKTEVKAELNKTATRTGKWSSASLASGNSDTIVPTFVANQDWAVNGDDGLESWHTPHPQDEDAGEDTSGAVEEDFRDIVM